MLLNFHREINELLILVRETTLYKAGLALDPNSPRAPGAAALHSEQEARKQLLLKKYDLSETSMLASEVRR